MRTSLKWSAEKMSVEEMVKLALAQHLKLSGDAVNQITPDANLINDLGTDSLGCVEIRMTMEEVFNVDIDAEYDDINTPRKLAEYVKKQLNIQ